VGNFFFLSSLLLYVLVPFNEPKGEVYSGLRLGLYLESNRVEPA
jgi:hypothetical protein